MFKNYLVIAVRTLFKQPGYTLINVLGLSVGIACCVLIMLFVQHEWSYDQFHTHADRIHRGWVLEDYSEEQRYFNTITPIPLGPALADHFPEVEAVVRINPFNAMVERADQSFSENILLAESGFFEVFSFPLRAGDPATVLSNPSNVVLTVSAAQRLLGTEDAIGQSLSIRITDEVTKAFTVSGIAEDVPSNSSVPFQILIPFEHGNDRWSERTQRSWTNVAVETYVLLRADTDVAGLEARFPAMVEQVLGDRFQPGEYAVGLQPLTDIHLNPEYPAGFTTPSDPAYAYILFGIAVLVLAIACINFMTLAIGRSASRAREVGVRKVVGADRKQLMIQFWGEALLLVSLALIVGVVLAYGLLPTFNALAGQPLVLAMDGRMIGFLFVLLLLVGLVAGSYPAAVLSGFRPMEVLKGMLPMGGHASLLRRSLVVVQFAVSIFLIISTLLMSDQLDYLQDRNLGFDKEQVVIIPTGLSPDEGMAVFELFRNSLAEDTEVVDMTASAFTFANGSWGNIGFTADDGIYREFMMNIVDHDYVETLGLEVIAGRNFSRDITADANQAILVNEAFARAYGWDNAIGQRIPGDFDDHQVIGVVKDFNYESMHTAVRPLVLTLSRALVFSGASDVSFGAAPLPQIAVRIMSGDLRGTLGKLEQTWASVSGDLPFAYQFLDEAVDSQYRAEEQLGRIVTIASVLAILIACLGLFGLAALTVVRRTKEIGIRKVMGASAPSIAYLLSRDFARLVLIATALAIPVAFIVMQQWLGNFVYHIQIGAGTFIVASVLVLLVAWLTVSYQAIRAALADPVEALRYE